MKVLTIGGKKYKFEFSIEASMNDECIEKVTNLMVGMDGTTKGEDRVKKFVSLISNVPKTAMNMFYVGLMEHHGFLGDQSVLNENEAKVLVRKYISECPEGESRDFYSIMEMMIDCMSDDGFFKLIGLEQMTLRIMEQTDKKKVPQDHKKKEKATEK